MNRDTLAAKSLLQSVGYTLVFCSGQTAEHSTERGVKPLLALLQNNKSLEGFCVADKVIGRAAAFLYVLLCPKEIYAAVISRLALEVLEKHGISVVYDTLTERIKNRAGTGLCPMESAVLEVDDPKTALKAIKEKLKTLKLNVD